MKACNFVKKRVQNDCFPVNFAIFKKLFDRTPPVDAAAYVLS